MMETEISKGRNKGHLPSTNLKNKTTRTTPKTAAAAMKGSRRITYNVYIQNVICSEMN